MRAKETMTAAASVAERPSDAGAVQLGTIVALLPDGTPQIALAGGVRVNARLAIRTTRDRIETAIALQQQVVVQFENGDRSRPIVMGFIERLEAKPASDAPGKAPRAAADVVR